MVGVQRTPLWHIFLPLPAVIHTFSESQKGEKFDITSLLSLRTLPSFEISAVVKGSFSKYEIPKKSREGGY